MEMGLGITLLSLLVWIGLLTVWGQFWRSDQRLHETDGEIGQDQPDTGLASPDTGLASMAYPSVCAVVPARNEADLLPITLRSLLQQDYPGAFRVVLVDDQSTDGTAEVAAQVAAELNRTAQLSVIQTESLPPEWTGKLWAMEKGIRHSLADASAPDYFLLTDADIEHDRSNLWRLIAKSQHEDLDLVSLMVLLRCQSFWEKLLIPAFVFFFQKLYPFRWVNQPAHRFAAAAGGCILIRRAALLQIGGLETLRQALIDDCALAQAVKRSHHAATEPIPTPSGKIWLGLTQANRSVRPYPSLQTIWDMVARTAFTQLRYSPVLLLVALTGMVLVYLVPPLSLIIGSLLGDWQVATVGAIAWLLMTLAYLPTIRLYGCPAWLALCLPLIALLYSCMTIDSALQHWRGQGGGWKGRVYMRTS